MRTLAHLSDLHFGRVNPRLVAPLLRAVNDLQPNFTIVSGDFVQNGVPHEFQQARDFIRQLPQPRILVPGNHDLPWSNLYHRFTIGLRLYREYITNELEPLCVDDEIAVMGVNTARLWPIRGGRINQLQVTRVEQRLCSLDPNLIKVLVTHHPFDLAPTYPRRELVGRARMAMTRLARSIDILLAGHMHVSHAGSIARRYNLQGNQAIFVQAGTATSTRERGEPNAFNLLTIDRPRLTIDRYQWQTVAQRFHPVERVKFTIRRQPASCPSGAEP